MWILHFVMNDDCGIASLLREETKKTFEELKHNATGSQIIFFFLHAVS